MAERKREGVLAQESALLGAEAGETSPESFAGSASGDIQANTMQQVSELGRELFAHTPLLPPQNDLLLAIIVPTRQETAIL